MDYIQLAIGLLLPWMGGYLSLKAVEAHFGGSRQTNPLRQVGFGFFTGLAGLYLLIQTSSTLIDRVPFWPIIIVIAAATLAVWLTSRQPNPGDLTSPQKRPFIQNVLFIALLFLIGCHLALGAAEVFNLPTYPWDAWLAWAYRAKAWYYSGYLVPFATPAEWLAGSANYTMHASGYPEFGSAIPYWAATSYGDWSETLVNTPVILCGLALVLAVYGSCREYGLGPLSALLTSYLLISLPIIGTHLSLAGYADIWMAGFAGLGMLTLLQGLARKDHYNTCLGLAFLAFSPLVKNEGVVWLYLGLGLIIFNTIRPRYLIAGGVGITAIVGICSLSGYTALHLPVLGTVGIEAGYAYLPLVAPNKLHSFSLLEPYRAALLQHGSWNILAILVLLSTAALIMQREKGTSQVFATFVIALALSQVVIFGYTEQGKWAASYTAINRVPMQMAPPIIFLVVIGLGAMRPNSTRGPKNWLPILAPCLATIIVANFLIREMSPDSTVAEAPPVQVNGPSMRVVMGESQLHGHDQQVTAYQNGIAIISAGRGNMEADAYQHLVIDLYTDGHKSPSFFWRTLAQPSDLQILDINQDATIIDLSSHPQWTGKILEIGIAFYEPGANTAGVRNITLSQANLTSKTRALLDGWWTTLPWTQQSINWVAIGQEDQQAHPVSFLSAWLALSALLALPFYAFRRTRAIAFSPLPFAAILAWLALDGQWLHTRVDRLADTLETARQPGPPQILEGGDKHLAELAKAVKGTGLPESGRIALISDDGAASFEAQRTKYHLLPLSVYPINQDRLQAGNKTLDGLLLLTKPRNPDPAWLANQTTQLSRKLGMQPDAGATSKYGTLLRPNDE